MTTKFRIFAFAILVFCICLLNVEFATAQKQVVTKYPYINTVHETYTVDSNGAKQGLYKEFTRQGVLINEAYFVNGQQHGKAKVYADTDNAITKGRLLYDNTYSNGVLIEMIAFDFMPMPNGTLQYYKKYYVKYDKDGSTKLKEQMYDPKSKQLVDVFGVYSNGTKWTYDTMSQNYSEQPNNCDTTTIYFGKDKALLLCKKVGSIMIESYTYNNGVLQESTKIANGKIIKFKKWSDHDMTLTTYSINNINYAEQLRDYHDKIETYKYVADTNDPQYIPKQLLYRSITNKADNSTISFEIMQTPTIDINIISCNDSIMLSYVNDNKHTAIDYTFVQLRNYFDLQNVQNTSSISAIWSNDNCIATFIDKSFVNDKVYDLLMFVDKCKSIDVDSIMSPTDAYEVKRLSNLTLWSNVSTFYAYTSYSNNVKLYYQYSSMGYPQPTSIILDDVDAAKFDNANCQQIVELYLKYYNKSTKQFDKYVKIDDTSKDKKSKKSKR